MDILVVDIKKSWLFLISTLFAPLRHNCLLSRKPFFWDRPDSKEKLIILRLRRHGYDVISGTAFKPEPKNCHWITSLKNKPREIELAPQQIPKTFEQLLDRLQAFAEKDLLDL